MEATFEQLFSKNNKKEKNVLGDPWDILPIKNMKYAKNCEEIHLGNRNLEGVENFQLFPNVEVLWLNNNLVKTLIT